MRIYEFTFNGIEYSRNENGTRFYAFNSDKLVRISKNDFDEAKAAREEVDAKIYKNNERDEEMSKTEEATVTTTPAVIADAAPADVKKLEAAVSRVQKKIDKIAKSYIEIVGDVALLYEDKNFKTLGYKNIYDLAKDKFGMSRGTVNNLLSVYSRFGENYKLKDEYKDMSLRELLDHIRKEKAAQRTLEIGEETELDEVTDGGDEETDGNGAGGKKGKKETLVKFDFDAIDSWTVDELIEKFREELGDNFTIPANAHITFVVTE